MNEETDPPAAVAVSGEPIPVADPPSNLEAWARASLRHMWPGDDDDDPQFLRGIE
ncbi:hypothetical protein AB0M02_32390 [Actinoplanes sp. NPDC051861]|uniref:hypothetical protein n=1 Tax=Actinoplanes sp. NPDC051861 TaxID=3155170 RepID=UPI0034222715